MSKSARIYDATLTASAGSSVRVPAFGTICKLLTAPGGPVEVRTGEGSVYTLYEGQGFRAPDGFDNLVVRNASGVAQVITLFVGGDDFIDGRISGTVQVVDGERNKVIQGVCFRGVASQAGGGTTGALAEVWNGAATGKNVYVNSVRFGASAADTWILYSAATNGPINVGAGNNMDRTQAGSAAGIFTGNDGTVYGAIRNLATGYVLASTDLQIELPKPVLLRPGFGLIVQTTSLATNIRATFEWEEWPV